MAVSPYREIINILSKKLSNEIIKKLPKKWEILGDVLIADFPTDLGKYKKIVAKTYAHELNCKSVLNNKGGVTGEFREPRLEILFGSNDIETVHKENAIRFKLNPLNIMFSSGNISERIHMSNLDVNDEVIVDLFAGIGYFTLPIAVYGRAKKIFACEKNINSFNYLLKNISLNNVTHIVEPIFGDNRTVAPRNIADRVIMGYIGDTIQFLSTAFNCLKNHNGVVHFHDKFPDNKIPYKPYHQIKNHAKSVNRTVDFLDYRRIKSYAPGISHYVFDLKVK
jgi:tRNA wybutosine-synthesizing protein 2